MQVPSFLFGRFRDVKAACRRKVTMLKRGASWDDLAGDLIDTGEYVESENAGLLVLDGPNPMVGGGEHFHFFAIAQALRNSIPERLPRSSFDTLFEPMIHTTWGFLAVLGQWGMSFLYPPGHEQRVVHLAVRWWNELDAEGPRYSKGSDHGKLLWRLPTGLQRCLARQGLPLELFKQPVPAGGMAELAAMTRAGLPPGPDDLH